MLGSFLMLAVVFLEWRMLVGAALFWYGYRAYLRQLNGKYQRGEPAHFGRRR
jgi:hypothetical protein